LHSDSLSTQRSFFRSSIGNLAHHSEGNTVLPSVDASALTAFNARAGKAPASWGATALSVSSACSTSEAATVPVVFNVNVTTTLGRKLHNAAIVTQVYSIPCFLENIYLTGSVGALTDWSTTDAILMSSADCPIWSSTYTLSSTAYALTPLLT
jgi:hypothetical protein